MNAPRYGGTGAHGMSWATWVHWEIVRYLDSENPGRNGYFTSNEAA